MKNSTIRQFLTALLIMAALVFVTTGQSCKKKKESAESAEAAASTVYQLSGLVEDLVRAADRAFDEGLLDVSLRPTAVKQLRRLNDGVKQAQNIIGQYEVNNEMPPRSVIEQISKIMSHEVVGPLTQFMADLGILPGTKVPYLQEAIAALRLAILAVAGSLSENGYPINTEVLSNAG